MTESTPAATPRASAPARPLPGTRPARRAGALQRPALSTGLGWLSASHGELRDANGEALRLLGLRGNGRSADADLRDAEILLEGVAAGQRCVALSLGRVAQMTPAALATLDERIARHAEAGTYTLLRVEARLWVHGHHLRLARRYVREAAVLFALIGREPLSARLWAAATALRAAHPRAIVWLPLESAAVALAAGADQGVGLLWDATRPQGPRAPALSGTLRQPLLLDGWEPAAHSAMAHDRLMNLCRRGGIGWLAHSSEAWLANERGQLVPSRAARTLQRAVYLSSFQTDV